ncbi:MAG: 4-hydroxythreonine-4-phosphate dehydrogenase PdxA [Saprospiraceae bacterium]|nr:4-hydroxythreonine-4-phosphate dehydrogenase PdxA [Saprospiraceae bacterium]
MKIGITIGDVNGIGPEIIIKTLSEPTLLKLMTPVIYGSSKILSYHKNMVPETNFQFSVISHADQAQKGRVNLINCWDENVNITLGKPTAESGKCAGLALDRAVDDAKAGLIQGIVTAPIHKYAMKLSGFQFPGHTEFLAAKDEKKESLMVLFSDHLKVAMVTNHIPLKEVTEKITKELILKKLQIFNRTLIENFGLEKPVLAVLGLNPHAGDEGALGNEEETMIRPAIIEAKKSGMVVAGPYPADAFFGNNTWSKVDGVLAMYHDQGLIPFKTIAFGEGTNFTAGLSFIRTSPDHGTAYDIAGQNLADPSSFMNAVFKCIDLVRATQEYRDDRANPLAKVKKQAAGLDD